jgi:spore coat protein U-like protein
MKKVKSLVLAVSLAFASAVPPAAWSGSMTGSMPVSITLVSACTSVSASPMSFGSASAEQAGQATAQSTITVNCNDGAAYSIDLDNGLQPESGTGLNIRQVRNQSQSNQYLPYRLFLDSSESSAWGSGQASGSVATGVMGGAGTANHTVYGRVYYGTTSQAGTYTDTVTVTVTY